MGKLIVRIASLLLIAAFLPTAVLAAEWNLENGSIEITATANAEGGTTQTVSQGGSSAEDSNPTITSNGKQTSNTITIKAGGDTTANVTIEDANIRTSGTAIKTEGEGNVNLNVEGTNTVTSGVNHAGVEKSNGGKLTIGSESGEGKLTANGGKFGAGIGGGDSQSGNDITITGGEIIANGGESGAGIGGGICGSGRDITISGDSQVKAAGGVGDSEDGCGAAIGSGGYNHWGYVPVDGSEKEPDTSGLYTTGKVERKRGDGTVLDTIIGTVEPPKTDEPEKSASSEEEPDKREPLYRVLNLDGSSLKHQAETADGVLTLTASADGATLTGTLRALGYLQNQGIEKITFTDGTHTATIVLADLIAKGEAEDIYVLTLGAANTLTLNGEAIDF